MQSAIEATYWSKGWVVFDDVSPPDEVDALAELAMTMSLEGSENALEDHPVDASPSGETAPRKIGRPFLKHPAFRAFVLDRRLTNIIATLLQADPLLLTDQIFMKPPRFGSAKPYHQDNYYFQCQPADQLLTAWVALDDVDAENGCLRYIDGSHRDGLLPHAEVPELHHTFVPPPKYLALDKESLAPVRKGSVVFHHGEALHTSHRNESDRWRRGYASHWVTRAVTSSTDTIEHAYFNANRPEYSGAVDKFFCNYMVV